MTPPTAFTSVHPQLGNPNRAADGPNRQVLFARSLKQLWVRPTRLIIVALWLVCLITGSFFLARYESTPGSDAPGPSRWPSGISVPQDLNLPTLVMFLHPNCPCSRASVGELALIMARCRGRIAGVVMIAATKGLNEPEKSGLWSAAELIPGVTVLRDQGGVAARRFHAATSGHVVLYNKDGSLLFAGGITSARAHSGDNAGRDSIVALVAGKESLSHTTPTFGCPIFNPEVGAPSPPRCCTRLASSSVPK